MSRIPKDSLHAIVTDPPYGVKEYDFTIFAQRSAGTLGTILTVMLVASAAGMAIARYLT
jgi:tRNA G10  N-methylase Trm11